MKKHVGYKVEAGSDFDVPVWFRGFVTYFDGTQVVITSSDRLKNKDDAWRWIAEKLQSFEFEEEKTDTVSVGDLYNMRFNLLLHKSKVQKRDDGYVVEFTGKELFPHWTTK